MLHILSCTAQYIVVIYERLSPHIVQLVFFKVTSQKPYMYFFIIDYKKLIDPNL